MVSCSGIQLPPPRGPGRRHLTCETWRPRERWTEAQSPQRSTPRFIDAQEGPEAPQSAQRESGWVCEDPEPVRFSPEEPVEGELLLPDDLNILERGSELQTKKKVSSRSVNVGRSHFALFSQL